LLSGSKTKGGAH
jgi:hypothetical protein